MPNKYLKHPAYKYLNAPAKTSGFAALTPTYERTV